jgi:hypothetical protein
MGICLLIHNGARAKTGYLLACLEIWAQTAVYDLACLLQIKAAILMSTMPSDQCSLGQLGAAGLKYSSRSKSPEEVGCYGIGKDGRQLIKRDLRK